MIFSNQTKESTHVAGQHQVLSYKLDVSLSPNWQAILEKLANDNKQNSEEFVSEFLKDEKLRIKEGEGLCNKTFRFVYFSDGISGMRQVWSDYHKTFVDNMEIIGLIFKFDLTFFYPEKYKGSNILNYLVCTPEFLGFHTVLPQLNDVLEKEKLAIIPFWDIIYFLIDVHKNISGFNFGAMSMIKKFPRKLQDKFSKNNVKYEDYDYEHYGMHIEPKKELIESEWAKKNDIEIFNQKMRGHLFSTQYYQIYIRLSFFN